MMLSIAGVWSVIQVKTIGKSVENLLDENYNSIKAVKSMRDAIEKEESAILLMLNDYSSNSDSMLAATDKEFLKQLAIAKDNSTIASEDSLLEVITQKYSGFKKQWNISGMKLPVEQKLSWYFENIHSSFVSLLQSVDDFSSLNNQEIYSTSVGIKDKARRAIIPGIVAVLSAILFTMMFFLFVNLYVITPINKIKKGLDGFIKNRIPYNQQINNKDELGELSETASIVCSIASSDE